MNRTKIGWTDYTWNPVTGCSHVSAGCEHCYAEALSTRLKHTILPWTARHAVINVKCHPERLDGPLTLQTPSRIFCCSMSDLFHERVPNQFIATVFCVMAEATRHTFQILTKRPSRMADLLSRFMPLHLGPQLSEWPLRNVHIGISAEDQATLDERAAHLAKTPARVRCVSLEPLLGPVDLSPWLAECLDWVVVGGESGPQHRAMEIACLEDLVRQCIEAHVPIYVKQDAGPRPGQQGRIPDELWIQEFPRCS